MKKIKLFFVAIFSLILVGCDDFAEASTNVDSERNIETEFVDGVILDRRFTTDSSTGHHKYNVVIGYEDLTTNVNRDAELYNDYKIGDSVPVQIIKNMDDRNLDRLKYIRDFERNKLLKEEDKEVVNLK